MLEIDAYAKMQPKNMNIFSTSFEDSSIKYSLLIQEDVAIAMNFWKIEEKLV